ncbi:MAG: 4'-phosphopantetheinyl transferase superfamily protein [Anaerolinea sp.]|nr:4'-phosphopantetheinyl transferase superfamily protein [Anaerolinea sp.]
MIWQTPPPDLTLPPDAVHVWQVHLEPGPQRINDLSPLLAADERERAARFYFDRDRQRYIVGRGALRTLIGRYLCISPQDVQFVYGAYGKPELAVTMGAPQFAFNVSHAQTLALCAFSWGRPLGVDIEFARQLDDTEGIARISFSPREFAIFQRLPQEQQQEAFFNCWTRKEAFVKAIGEGLSHPLHQFDVTFVPGEAARLIYVAGDADAASQWRLLPLHPHPQYQAALIVRGHDWQLSQFMFTER